MSCTRWLTTMWNFVRMILLWPRSPLAHAISNVSGFVARIFKYLHFFFGRRWLVFLHSEREVNPQKNCKRELFAPWDFSERQSRPKWDGVSHESWKLKPVLPSWTGRGLLPASAEPGGPSTLQQILVAPLSPRQSFWMQESREQN